MQIRGKKTFLSSVMPALRPAFCVLALLISVTAFTQNLDTKISLHIKNKPLSEVLDKIESSSGIKLSYSSQVVPVDERVNLDVESKPVRQILTDLLSKWDITFILVEDHVVLKKQKTNEDAGSSANQTNYTISGYIKDLRTGECLIGASIYAKGTNYGAVSNAYGFFSLSIPAGKYTLTGSFIGYEPIVQQINLSGSLMLKIDLDPVKLTMDEVEIVDNDEQNTQAREQVSGMKLSPMTLDQMPGFAGDLDVVKSLDAVPGINSFGDGSSLFYVRGGASDQNYLIIDEAPVYNPSHLFGFFTAFAPDAIKEVEAFKGDFPAKYGGRLSSVIDVKTKDGNMKQFGFSGNLGPYVSSLTIEGPVIKDVSSFFVSARKSNLNWLSNSNNTTKAFDLNFFDLNAKLNFTINDNNRLYLTLYGGKDDFTRVSASAYRTFGISWDNMLGSIRWNHVFNHKLFSNTTFYLSKYNYYLFIDKTLNDYWNSAISTAAIKSDFTWYLNTRNTFRAGFELSRMYSNPGNVHFEDPAVLLNAPVVPDYYSRSLALYIGNEQIVSKRFSFRYGIRLSAWQNKGPATVYYYDANHQVIGSDAFSDGTTFYTQFSPEPRLNIRYAAGKNAEIKASYSRTTQYLQVLTNSVSPFTSMEVWAPAGPNIKPQHADQFATGYFHRFLKGNLIFSAEAFYKHFYNQIDFEDHPDMLYNPYLEGELRFGKAWSYGLELMLRKTTGRFTGWIGYTYTRAKRRIDEVNNNKTFPAYYDRPHDLCMNLSYSTRKYWVFAASWIFVSGGAITTPTGFYTYNGYTVPVYGDKNNSRLPDYHRLDLAITCKLNPNSTRFKHSVMLSFYNAYGRKNPFSLNYNKIMNDNGDFVVPSDLEGGYEIIPTSLSVAGIIPSLNYIFRF